MFRHDDDSDLIGFDMSKLMALGFLLIILVLIQYIAEEDSEEESISQGSVIVEMYWDDSLNTDVDLWVKAPGDIPVGYSNKGGLSFNLLRDDLGKIADVSERNMEISNSRGIPAGEYVVNAHLYRLGNGSLPIDVKVVVSVKRDSIEDGKVSLDQLFAVDLKLVKECHEKTAVVFTLDSEGNLDENSVHHTQTNLRSREDCGLSGMDGL